MTLGPLRASSNPVDESRDQCGERQREQPGQQDPGDAFDSNVFRDAGRRLVIQLPFRLQGGGVARQNAVLTDLE
jgi:hypothetical protein